MIRTGLTLVEVLAVIVILGLLAVTLAVGLGGKLGTARHGIAVTQIGKLASNVEMFLATEKRVPTASEGLDVLSTNPKAAYYIDKAQLNDPWGRPYYYVVPGPDGHAYEIRSLGADGQQGGDGEDADITSVELGG